MFILTLVNTVGAGLGTLWPTEGNVTDRSSSDVYSKYVNIIYIDATVRVNRVVMEVK